MNLIWLLLRESRWQVAIAIITGLISGGCSARLLALINEAVNGQGLPQLTWSFGLLLGVVLITGPISQFTLINLSQDAVYRLRMQLSRRILAAPLRQLEEQGVNRLLATLTDDVATLSTSVFAIPFLCIDIAIILGCFIYLASLSGVAFLGTVSLMVLSILGVQVLLTKARRYLSLARAEQDQLMKHFKAVTDGVKELKLHRQRRQEFVDQELSVSADASRRYTATALNIFAIATASGQMLFFVMLAILVFGLPRLITLDNSLLSAYVLTLAYLMAPFKNLMERIPILMRTSVSLQKIEQLGLNLARQAEDTSAGALRAIASWRTLNLSQITHTYRGEFPEDRFLLGPLSLEFQPGELVFIVGGNGSGKSTLAKIITGLYLPESGQISFNGEPITDQNREWYRQHFSTVYSDFFLFDKLLGFSSTKADFNQTELNQAEPNQAKTNSLDQQAHYYLQQLQIDHKVKVNQGVLSTVSLSQGQRKRLALLTAYLEDRPIYLFDEWASDQDPVFRALFYEEILPKLKAQGKLVLVISHDDRYFHLADRVIKLDYGQIESIKAYTI